MIEQFCSALHELSFLVRSLMVLGAMYVCAVLMYVIGERTMSGSRWRIFTAILVYACGAVLPMMYNRETEIVPMGVCGLVTMWLLGFKAMGWAVGRGPLAEDLSHGQFAAVAILPITPVTQRTEMKQGRWAGRARQGEFGHGVLASLVDFAGKTLILSVLTYFLRRIELPLIVVEFCYALILYLLMAAIMNLVSILCIFALDIRVAPHFDQPYMSSSLADFWSRRWNLNTGYTLRFLVYDPICEGCLLKNTTKYYKPYFNDKEHRKPVAGYQHRPGFIRRGLGTCAAFVVSGILHEIFILYFRSRLSGFWMAFFSLQGPLLVLESFLRSKWRALGGRNIPNALAVPWTILLLLFMGHILFFPDIERMGLTDDAVENLAAILLPKWAI